MSDILDQPSRSLFTHLVVAIGRLFTPKSLAGQLRLTLPGGQRIDLGQSTGPAAELHLTSWRCLWSSMRRGAVGFCEGYMTGDWDSPAPERVFDFYLRNREALDTASRGIMFRSLAARLWHLLHANNRSGSKANIEAHYDLGNAFYSLWLDRCMSYSSAYFGRGAQSLLDAQDAKYQLVADSLEARSGQSLLEIGCGWGGFAEVAAARGLSVTGITLSHEQLAFARERLGDKADLRLQDYRDTQGTFDRIEMIEAVGEAHWPDYFRTLHDRLKPGGIAAIQAITIDQRWFEQYRTGVDFIQRHIFPGGMLPTREIIQAQAAAVGLLCEEVALFGRDYARTLAIWRQRFDGVQEQLARLGFDEVFRRKWRLYFCYCEAGFAHGDIDVGVYRFRKAA